MPNLTAIDSAIDKLRNRTEPLSVEHCKKFADWLEAYMREHDSKLINTIFLKVEEALVDEIK